MTYLSHLCTTPLLSGPEPVLFSPDPVNTAAMLAEHPDRIIPGLTAILQRLTVPNGLDLEDALEHIADPVFQGHSSPFGARVEQPANKPRKKQEAKTGQQGSTKSKGRTPSHSNLAAKYGEKSMPSSLKKLLLKNMVLPDNMRTKIWFKSISSQCSKALAKKTWARYATVLKIFDRFCRHEKVVQSWPISQPALNGFILWLKDSKKLKISSIKTYISALAGISTLLGLDFPNYKKGFGKIILGNSAEKLESAKDCTHLSDPVTFEMLKFFRLKIKTKRWSALNKKSVWAAICTGFFGSFRAGELLAKKQWVFDKESDLLWQDISKRDGDCISIHIKIPKILKKGGDHVQIFKFSKIGLCPIRALKSLQKTQMATGMYGEALPVFRLSSGKNLTVAKLTHILAGLVQHSQFSNQKISAKSLRAGIPSEMESDPAQADDGLIKNWGRWRSTAYQRYMKNDTPQKRWIFEKISNILLNFQH